MFDSDPQLPRIFALALGHDFAAGVVAGIRHRMEGSPQEDSASVTLIVNTARMRRRIQKLFCEGTAGFQPRILLLSDLDSLLDSSPPPQARPALERRLQLAALFAPVLKDRPELAPSNSLFAMSDSLAQLMDEMQGEGVSIDAIRALDVTDESRHWENAKALFQIAYDYVTSLDGGLDPEARQRGVVQELISQWAEKPPTNPIILAGSTGSRGTTALLMEAVAQLPRGAIILPGYDEDLPDAVWAQMTDAMRYEDHPQFRFARLLHNLDLPAGGVAPWVNGPSPTRARNRVISLALRPAPVTDAWLSEGQHLPDLREALKDVALIEATSQAQEAQAIAIRIRMAVEGGKGIALITPDRMLGRQVTAKLDRWRIVPDDSGGLPLHLTAPGRLLRHTAELLSRPLNTEMLLTLLKHPLTQSGSACPEHGLFTQRLELELRKAITPFPTADDLTRLTAQAAGERPDQQRMEAWAQWLAGTLFPEIVAAERPVSELLEQHRRLTEALCSGSHAGSGGLWEKSAGQTALGAITDLEANAHHAHTMSATDYANLLSSVLNQHEVRDQHEPHPNVMIWGTLEARVQGADIVILGGLNDGVWPESPAADPWLNRRMRMESGLLLPDRRVGLSAHDFQQAIAAPDVVITRSTKSDDAETVPSRWLSRLTNMIAGLPNSKGPEALQDMRSRGEYWQRQADAFDRVEETERAGRPAPIPPVATRPRQFSVTEIKTLIRDPYAIYARHVLGLRPLNPLVPEPDALMRGIVIHDILERFVRNIMSNPTSLTQGALMAGADEVLNDRVPWPTAQIMMRARLARNADWIITSERLRMEMAAPCALESDARGLMDLPNVATSIRARADRIDLTPDGRAILYDYKSGSPPGPKEQRVFDKQLLIEAAMIENGAFPAIGPRPVAHASYIGLGTKPREQPAPLEKEPPAKTLAHLEELISAYLDPAQYFLSRRMPRSEKDEGDYDHLARFNEWDATDDPDKVDLS